jgi:hypothetical protein
MDLPEPPDSGPPGRRAGRRLALESSLVGGAFLVLYLLTRSRNLSAAADAIFYANDIAAGAHLHPHHLLYNWLSVSWSGLWSDLGLGGGVDLPVIVLNSTGAALAVALVHLFLRRNLAWRPLPAVLGAALPGLSFGVWFYGTTVEVYTVPLALVLLAFLLLVSLPARARTGALLGLVHGSAILFHQSHVLFVPAVAVGLLGWRRSRGPSARKSLAVYLVVLVLVISIGYGAATLGALGLDPSGAVTWMTSTLEEDAYWNAPGPTTVAKAAKGFSQALVGGHFAFAVPALESLTDRAFPSPLAVTKQYLVRDMEPAVAWLLLGLTATLGALLLGAVAGGVRRRRESGSSPVLPVLVAWIVFYTLFFFFWVPSKAAFWVPVWTALWLVLFVLWGEAGRARTPAWFSGGVLVLVALLGTVNAVGSILPLANEGNDYFRARVREVERHASRGDLVVVGNRGYLYAFLVHEGFTNVLVLEGGGSSSGDRNEGNRRAAVRIRRSLLGGAGAVLMGVGEAGEEAGGLSRERLGLLEDALDPDCRARWRRLEAKLGALVSLSCVSAEETEEGDPQETGGEGAGDGGERRRGEVPATPGRSLPRSRP